MPFPRTLLALSAILLLAAPAHAASRVLVLPFDTPPDDASLASLGPGTMDSLITALSRVPDFVLVDRSTLDQLLKEQAFQQSGQVDEGTAVRMGKLIGAQAIIRGRIQVAADKVRLSASFIDAETGRIRRAEQVTGRLDEVFDLQDQLAHRFIADQGVTVTSQAEHQMSTVIRSTGSMQAYDAYQKGQQAYHLTTSAGYEDAVAWYDKALQADPNYALAWAGKADTIAALVWMHAGYYHTTAVTYADGLAAANKALALQPDLPQAHRAMALILCAQGKYAEAMNHAQIVVAQAPNLAESWMTLWLAGNSHDPDDPALLKALELNPRMSLAHVQRAMAYGRRGKLSAAMASAETAKALSPEADTIEFLMGLLLFYKGHPVKALEAFQTATQINPKNAAAFNQMGDALRSLSRYDEAMAAYRSALRLRPDFYDARASLMKLERQDR